MKTKYFFLFLQFTLCFWGYSKTIDTITIDHQIFHQQIIPNQTQLKHSVNNNNFTSGLPAQIHPNEKIEVELFFKTTETQSLYIEIPDNKINFFKIKIKDVKTNELLFNKSIGGSGQIYKNNYFLLNVKPNTIYQINYQLNSQHPCYPFIWFWHPKVMLESSIVAYWGYGLLIGSMFLICLGSLLFYFIIKNRRFLLYSTYLLGALIYITHYHGLANHWFYTLPFETKNLYAIGSFIMTTAHLVFFYLIAQKHISNLLQTIKIIISIRFIYLVLLYFFSSLKVLFVLVDFIPLLTILYFLATNISITKKHFKIYALGLIILTNAYLLFMGSYYQFWASNYLIYNSIFIGIFLEALFMLVALINEIQFNNKVSINTRNKLIKQYAQNEELQKTLIQELEEKNNLREKVNLELENKVKERTIALEKANQELAKWNRKWETISNSLDKKNWELTKEQEVIKKDYIHQKSINYQEFISIYKDEYGIKKHFFKQKKNSPYRCKKCNKLEAIVIESKFIRKCASCSYEESLYLNTLFENLKFPLIKAYYIAYKTFIHGEDYIIRDMAEEIDLREATVWNFRKKVIDKLKNKDKERLEDILINLPSE